MKKFPFIFTGLLFLLTIQSQAQIHLVPAAGVTISKPNNDAFNPKAGYKFGASLRIGEKWFIQPGLFYTQYSSEVDWNDLQNTPNIDLESFNQTGWEVPVMVGYQFINADMFKFRAYAGPQIGFGYKTNGNNFTDVFDTESTQWAVKAGLGVDILFFTLDADYGWGLSDNFKVDQAFSNSSFQNRSFNITLGVRI
ncbi:porin family protein [Persicobacter sp. CCB-QB2]|uniref:porin family protein n=1 Tax=Persicobacter sp. CCB-QB2 TaxID=1561025 RepID=UPI0006A9D076|nr:porin family protein [Persicobacter sp. CCB-QB2]